MHNFALELIEEIVGKLRFYKLVIDDNCPYDKFCEEIRHDSNLHKQLITILSRMNDIANMKLLPANKFKNVTPVKEKVKEYEIKTPDLRVYLIKDDAGHLIVTGGKKNSQSADFKRFRSIKKQYLASKL